MSNLIVMPQFGSELWFEPELLEPVRKFGPKFRETVEPNFSEVQFKVQRLALRFEPEPNF